MKIAQIFKCITNSDYRFLLNSNITGCPGMNDEDFLRRKFKACMGRELNLDNPKTFNEKLQWLKLYDRKPEYTQMVDKYEVKKLVAEIIGEEYIIPTLGVWDRPEDIDFDTLPNRFVLKCNHNSGLGMFICKDKSKMNVGAVRRALQHGLAQDYYLSCKEWPYKNVPRKIIAEQYMEDAVSTDLRDYKLMCFDGKVKCSFVCSDRHSSDGLHVTFFDKGWNVMPFERSYPAVKEGFPKPLNYEKMVLLAEKLSAGIPFLRVDFYEVNGKVYFGELTFFPGSGLEAFQPEQWDYTLGSWLVLPAEKNS